LVLIALGFHSSKFMMPITKIYRPGTAMTTEVANLALESLMIPNIRSPVDGLSAMVEKHLRMAPKKKVYGLLFADF
jgi:hypothetical protein